MNMLILKSSYMSKHFPRTLSAEPYVLKFVCFCSLIAQIPSGGSYETFASVGRYIFNDGVYNWGRVVSLFYLAYKMIVKVCTCT